LLRETWLLAAGGEWELLESGNEKGKKNTWMCEVKGLCRKPF
jgi:hypothetical protein